MPFIQHDQPIQAFSADRADQALAERIRLRASHRRLQYRQTHRRHRVIDGGCVNTVAVVDQKSLGLIAGHNRAELLDRPRGRRMLGHVPMHDPTRADIQDHEDIHRTAGGG